MAWTSALETVPPEPSLTIPVIRPVVWPGVRSDAPTNNRQPITIRRSRCRVAIFGPAALAVASTFCTRRIGRLHVRPEVLPLLLLFGHEAEELRVQACSTTRMPMLLHKRHDGNVDSPYPSQLPPESCVPPRGRHRRVLRGAPAST